MSYTQWLGKHHENQQEQKEKNGKETAKYQEWEFTGHIMVKVYIPSRIVYTVYTNTFLNNRHDVADELNKF